MAFKVADGLAAAAGQVGEGGGGSEGEKHYRQIEEEYSEDREKVKPSGYMSSQELEEAAKKVEIEDRGSPEEQKTAAELRRQKEKMYEEGKKKLS